MNLMMEKKLSYMHPQTTFKGRVLRQEKDVSLFLDRTGEPATQHRDSSRLKIKTRPFLDQGLALSLWIAPYNLH